VSDFIHSLARRGAGIAPIVAVQPPLVPDFAPGLPTKVWRPASRLAGGIQNAGEMPHPTANLWEPLAESIRATEQTPLPAHLSPPPRHSSSQPVDRPDQEVGQEVPPTQAAASEQIPPSSGAASSSYPPVAYPESPGSPARASDQGTGARPPAPHSLEQQTSVSPADKTQEREFRPSDNEAHALSDRPVSADPARASTGPSTTAASLEAQSASVSEPAPVVQYSPADPVDSSDMSSSSQGAKRRHGPTVEARAAHRVREAYSPVTTDDAPAGLPAAPNTESRVTPDPEPAPVRPDSISEADYSPRVSSPAQGVREHYAPVTRTRAPRRTEKRPNPEAAETIRKGSNREGAETLKPSNSTPPGEPAVKQVGSNPALLRTEEPLSGEPATSAEPASPTLVRPEPAPAVASPTPVRPAPVIVPEQAHPQTLPQLHRPSASQPEPDLIQVHIGSLEVRASTPPPAPLPAPVLQGFDDYAAVRSYAGWEKA
jgi:hypothetical protein